MRQRIATIAGIARSRLALPRVKPTLLAAVIFVAGLAGTLGAAPAIAQNASLYVVFLPFTVLSNTVLPLVGIETSLGWAFVAGFLGLNAVYLYAIAEGAFHGVNRVRGTGSADDAEQVDAELVD